MIYALFGSFLATNAMHAYLLYDGRHEKNFSISHQAASSKNTLNIYIAGHFIGSLIFIIFAYQLFYIEEGSKFLFILTFITCISNILQAVVPAKKPTELIHLILASITAVLLASIIVIAPLVITLTENAKNLYVLTIFIQLLGWIFPLKNRNNFYITQMIFYSVFFLQMLILVYGRV